jgi:uncharacterized OB-fold protein
MSTCVTAEWYSDEVSGAYLVGLKCEMCGTYCFPPTRSSCRNPLCGAEQLQRVPLSRTGKLWSYTVARLRPPAPYISSEQFAPFIIAAVDLTRERMTVLGHVSGGVDTETLAIGMAMEVVIEPLCEQTTTQILVWKWRPRSARL